MKQMTLHAVFCSERTADEWGSVPPQTRMNVMSLWAPRPAIGEPDEWTA